MSDVAARVLWSLEPAFRAKGISFDSLLVEHGLSPTRVRRLPASRIAWNAFADFLEDAAERLGGLSVLEEIGSTTLLWDWENLRALLSRYVTPLFGYELGVRWIGPAIFRGTRGRLIEVPGGIVETVEIHGERRDSPEFFRLCGGAIREFPRTLGWETTEFEMVHSDRKAEYRVQYAKSRDAGPNRLEGQAGVRLSRDLEEIAILQLDPFDVTRLGTSVDSLEDSVSVRVRQVLLDADCSQSWAAADVARRLAMSERSLARRLSQEETSFRAIRDEVRCEVAIRRIRSGAAILEVGGSLGFSDVVSFHRAFKRWTGRPPGRFRRHSSRPT